MELKVIDKEFSVCKVSDFSEIDTGQPYIFTGSTDEERSLVCPTELVPGNTIERNDGWWKSRANLTPEGKATMTP